MQSFNEGAAMCLAAASEGKYKCLRHLIRQYGIGFFCAAGILLAAAGTAGTGGGATPALIGAVVACVGAAAMNFIDEILYHLGIG